MKDSAFHAHQIASNVFWVGAVDWNLRDFHGYATERGTSYNAYLILADKVTLVDTVKAPFMDEMLSRIASVIPPEKIDYVISNHAEMDHSGALPAFLRSFKPEKVIASTKGAEALQSHFGLSEPVETVEDGQTLSLGGAEVTFVETRMLHWPDSMFSFLSGEGILFSQDAFGMHLASAERYADELDRSVLAFEAAKYYANILMPYARLVGRLLDRVTDLNLPIRMIAPDHGPIYRKDLDWIVDLYRRFSERKPTRKAVITYDTMWGSTDQMARAIAEGINENGCVSEIVRMETSHRSNVATALLDAGAFVVGSPTINNHMFPSIADVLSYIAGLRPTNLVGAAFGSFGWSGEAVGLIEEQLTEIGIELAVEGMRVNYVPTEQDLISCKAFGAKIAERMKESCPA